MFCVKNKLDILGGQGEEGSKKVFTFGFESKTNIFFLFFLFQIFWGTRVFATYEYFKSCNFQTKS